MAGFYCVKCGKWVNESMKKHKMKHEGIYTIKETAYMGVLKGL